MEQVDKETDDTDRCVSLYHKVLARCVEDVTVKWAEAGSRSNSLKPTDDERRKSLLFLTSKSGKWKLSREIICEIIGLDGDLVRTETIKAIEQGVEFRISDFSSDYYEDGTCRDVDTEEDFSDDEWQISGFGS